MLLNQFLLSAARHCPIVVIRLITFPEILSATVNDLIVDSWKRLCPRRVASTSGLHIIVP